MANMHRLLNVLFRLSITTSVYFVAGPTLNTPTAIVAILLLEFAVSCVLHLSSLEVKLCNPILRRTANTIRTGEQKTVRSIHAPSSSCPSRITSDTSQVALRGTSRTRDTVRCRTSVVRVRPDPRTASAEVGLPGSGKRWTVSRQLHRTDNVLGFARGAPPVVYVVHCTAAGFAAVLYFCRCGTRGMLLVQVRRVVVRHTRDSQGDMVSTKVHLYIHIAVRRKDTKIVEDTHEQASTSHLSLDVDDEPLEVKARTELTLWTRDSATFVVDGDLRQAVRMSGRSPVLGTWSLQQADDLDFGSRLQVDAPPRLLLECYSYNDFEQSRISSPGCTSSNYTPSLRATKAHIAQSSTASGATLKHLDAVRPAPMAIWQTEIRWSGHAHLETVLAMLCALRLAGKRTVSLSTPTARPGPPYPLAVQTTSTGLVLNSANDVSAPPLNAPEPGRASFLPFPIIEDDCEPLPFPILEEDSGSDSEPSGSSDPSDCEYDEDSAYDSDLDNDDLRLTPQHTSGLLQKHERKALEALITTIDALVAKADSVFTHGSCTGTRKDTDGDANTASEAAPSSKVHVPLSALAPPFVPGVPYLPILQDEEPPARPKKKCRRSPKWTPEEKMWKSLVALAEGMLGLEDPPKPLGKKARRRANRLAREAAAAAEVDVVDPPAPCQPVCGDGDLVPFPEKTYTDAGEREPSVAPNWVWMRQRLKRKALAAAANGAVPVTAAVSCSMDVVLYPRLGMGAQLGSLSG
ncbi:hypothetical protein C8Q76DRAFT_781366 [Earliella scabrosa]|nr:hypothetical protein C8Q76DRAFT_781366 [Earliella scabrosa]